MTKTKLIRCNNDDDFEEKLNLYLENIQQGVCRIIDIKYQASAYEGYSALIIYEKKVDPQ